MSEPRFTIITPTWNQAEFLADTMDSVLSQSEKSLEYIIVDNCSDDGTEEIVRAYMAKDPRIIYVREPDHGQAEAINKGLKRAKGSIVAWLNSDDLYFDEKVLEKVWAAFEKEPSAGLVIGDAWYCDRDKKLTEHNPSDRQVPDWVIRRWYYIVQPAVFWRNKKAKLDERYHYVFDWKFFVRMLEREKAVFTHEDYALYRMYGDNKTGQNNAKRKREIWLLQKELGDSRANTAWCRFIYARYLRAEEAQKPGRKDKIDFFCRLVFHLSGKHLVSF
ncbi:MAG: glycosyltransferase [Lachnospiraceae bacterium]|nr:glycosyltransferase [Lachnospiraceae bacterium]